MAVFEYQAVDLDSTASVGTVIADTGRQARDVLRDRGLTITGIRPLQEHEKKTFRLGRRRGNEVEVAAFVRRLATLLRAGVPLLSALNTLSEQHAKRFKPIIQGLFDQVSAGVSLAEAMSRHPLFFDELCVNIVRVGENTGSLESALRRLADFKEKAHRLRSRVITALLYPTVVFVIGLAVSIFLMTYVVPNLLKTLTEAGRELPLITRVVKAASDLLLGWWWAVLAGIVCLALALRVVLGTERGRAILDRLVLRIPVLGDLNRKENTSRIVVVMAALLRSGLQFVDAIHIARRTVRNSVFRKAMDDYEAAVTAGSDVAGPLKASGVFSPMVVQMLAVGQQSGELEELLEQLAEAYDQEVNTATQRLTSLIEPLLIILLAIMIGFIVLATILPILEASNVL